MFRLGGDAAEAEEKMKRMGAFAVFNNKRIGSWELL